MDNANYILVILCCLPLMTSVSNENFVFSFAGIGFFIFITVLFERENYHNNKIYLLLTGILTSITLSITYIQLFLPSYQEYLLFNYIFTLLFIITCITVSYKFILGKRVLPKTIRQNETLNSVIIRFVIGLILAISFTIGYAYYIGLFG